MTSKIRRAVRERFFDGSKVDRRSALGAVFAFGFLIFLVEPIGEVLGRAIPVPTKVTEIAIMVLYGLCYPVAFFLGRMGSARVKVVFAFIVVFLGVTAVLMGGSADSIWLLTYAVVTSALILPKPIGGIVSLLISVLAFVYSAFQPGGPNWLASSMLLLMAVGMTAFARAGSDLDKANEEVVRLAAAEERARVARDIHDVLGHSLTTVTLKLGLIRRLLETSPDTAINQVLAEVADAERLSRQALSEVRATLSGYRGTSLTAEVAGARAVLGSVHIDADLPRAVDDVNPAYQESFAYVLREAVTNVLRHSGATRCEVRLGENWLEITDNGQAHAAAAASSRAQGGGTGLAGLDDRMRALGGRLDAGPLPGGGFRVRAEVPEKQSTTPITTTEAVTVAS